MTGPIPSWILSSPSLVYASFRQNQFTPPMPTNLAASLIHLDLSYNNFAGELVPRAWESLKSLEVLRLQHTEIIGPMPLFYRFPQLKELYAYLYNLTGDNSNSRWLQQRFKWKCN